MLTDISKIVSILVGLNKLMQQPFNPKLEESYDVKTARLYHISSLVNKLGEVYNEMPHYLSKIFGKHCNTNSIWKNGGYKELKLVYKLSYNFRPKFILLESTIRNQNVIKYSDRFDSYLNDLEVHINNTQIDINDECSHIITEYVDLVNDMLHFHILYSDIYIICDNAARFSSKN